MANKEIKTPTSGLTPEELAEAQIIRMNSSAEADLGIWATKTVDGTPHSERIDQ